MFRALLGGRIIGDPYRAGTLLLRPGIIQFGRITSDVVRVYAPYT